MELSAGGNLRIPKTTVKEFGGINRKLRGQLLGRKIGPAGGCDFVKRGLLDRLGAKLTTQSKYDGVLVASAIPVTLRGHW